MGNSVGGDDESCAVECCNALMFAPLVLLLLWIWHQEHVLMHEEMNELTVKLHSTRTDLMQATENFDKLTLRIDTMLSHAALKDLPGPAAALAVDSNVAVPPPPPPPPPLPPSETHRVAAALHQLAAGAPPLPLPSTPTQRGGSCISWRQTGGCTSHGTREPENDKSCTTKIWSIWSGYCECSWGKHEVLPLRPLLCKQS